MTGIKPKHFLVPISVVLLSLLVSLSAKAQDDGLSSYDLPSHPAPHNLILDEDFLDHVESSKALIYEEDSINRINAVAPKDEDAVTEDENSALSFNFLYYIIENFKFSDMVEKSK